MGPKANPVEKHWFLTLLWHPASSNTLYWLFVTGNYSVNVARFPSYETTWTAVVSL